MKLAQLTIPGSDPEGTPTQVELPNPTGLKPELTNIGGIVSELIPIVISVAGIILFIYLLWGGYDLLLSGGDPQKVEAGRTKITNAVIGFIIVFAAFFLTQLLGFLFGLETIF